MPSLVERMTCPVCELPNHSVTFLAGRGRIFHDCGHEVQSSRQGP